MLTRHEGPHIAEHGAAASSRWTERTYWAVLLLVCVAVVGVSARRYYLSDINALAASIQDDSFYYIVPAHHFPRTGMFTFDGRTPTYGFQPLYMLVLGGLATLFTGLEDLLRAALMLNALLFAATGLLIYSIVRTALRETPGAAALAAGSAVFYLTNAVVYLSATTAKENALAALILAGAIAIAQRLLREPGNPRLTSACLGAAGGLLLICRILPSTFLSLAVLLGAALLRKRAPWTLLVSFLIPPATWFGYAQITLGRAIPTSATVKTSGVASVRQSLAGQNLTNAASFGAEYARDAFAFALGHNQRFWMPQLGDAWNMGGSGTVMVSPWFAALRWLLVGGAILGLVGWGAAAAMSPRGGALLATLLAAQIAGHFCSAVILYKRGGDMNYFTWYFYDLPVLVPIALALCCGSLLRQVDRLAIPSWLKPGGLARGWGDVVLVSVLAVGAARFVYLKLPPMLSFQVDSKSWQHLMVESGRILRDEIGLRPTDRVAAYNCGALGFVLNGTVTNLDGLANDEIVRFYAAGGSLQQYVDRAKLTLYADAIDPANLGVRFHTLRQLPFVPENGLPYYHISRFLTTDEREAETKPRMPASSP
jgi:hypothetical protein